MLPDVLHIWTITFSTELLFIERTFPSTNGRVCKFAYKLLRGRSTYDPGFLPQWPLVSNGQNISVRGERDSFYKDFALFSGQKLNNSALWLAFLNRPVIQWQAAYKSAYYRSVLRLKSYITSNSMTPIRQIYIYTFARHFYSKQLIFMVISSCIPW